MKDNVVTRTALRYAVKEVIKDPDRQLPRALRLVRAFDQKGVNRKTYDALEVALEDSENNWNRYLHNIFSQVAPDILEKLTSSLLVNAAIASSSLRTENMNRYQCNVPWAILMDPTAACNLQCTGCWAAEYGKQTSLSYDTLDRIIREGKALGVYVYIFSGGEPLLRRADLIRLAEAHGDCVFLAFTNGTLVDRDFAKKLRQVGNFALAFSIEGFEEETDLRRGKGTYKAVIAAMELLRQEGVVFGFSTCYHRKNVDCVGSDAYVDFLINEGCLFGWYFTYIPIGAEAVPDLIATPDQRAFMYGKMRAWRQSKPCFLLDFWNDGEYVGGCIAGGRNYLHINANGDVEPCAFIHYSNVNIHSASLLEALRSPLFMEYRRNQPFNGNQLRPCPLLDNPEKLRIMVMRSGAHSTEMENPEDVGTLTAKTQDAAEAWAPVAQRLWNDSKHG
ncbi:MAG TPA: radical SAM protein [Clostridia bacterium]|nr:radical SAM protein [Clostridia bacterium]